MSTIIANIRVVAEVLPIALCKKFNVPRDTATIAINTSGELVKKRTWQVWSDEVEGPDVDGKYHREGDNKDYRPDDIVTRATPEQHKTYCTVDEWTTFMVNLVDFVEEYRGEFTVKQAIVAK